MLRTRTLLRSAQILSRPAPSSARSIHHTAPVLKKKSKGAGKATEEDGFDEEFVEDDLFGGGTSKRGQEESVMPKQVKDAQKPIFNANTTNAKRAALFEAERKELTTRFTRGRFSSEPRARKTAIRSILRFADTSEQLETVKELVEGMRKAKVSLDPSTAKEFFGRCITLHQPDVALQVLADRPRYRLDLDLNTARDLMHSIFFRATKPTPLAKQMTDEYKPFTSSHHQDALFLAGLYPHFGLISASEDPISSALLMSIFSPSREIQMTDIPQVEGLASHGDIAKEFGKELLKNESGSRQVRRSAFGDPTEKRRTPFLRRHQVWLDSELRRADVKNLLTELGFDRT